MRTIHVDRYVTPLREGGSLPAIVEADDLGLYVLKFRGAGQGPKALVAEVIAAGLARHLDLPVPEVVLAELDGELARTEPDPEIQDLIRASSGLNVAIDYLPGSANFDPVADRVDGELASKVVWFDALISNVDRTVRNTNLLTWHGRLWLIDHGAAFYFHHGDGDWSAGAANPFARIADHVLLPRADRLAEVDADLAARLTPERIAAVLATIPAGWLVDGSPGGGDRGASREGGVDGVDEAGRQAAAEARRQAYLAYLVGRLARRQVFVETAIAAAATARPDGDPMVGDPARGGGLIRAGQAGQGEKGDKGDKGDEGDEGDKGDKGRRGR